MKLLGIKIVKVGEMEFPIKVTNRAMIEYEALSGGNMLSFEGTEKLLMFFYSTAKAAAKSTGVEFTYTYDEFLDVIDDYYLEVVTNFTAAIASDDEDSKKKQKVNE